VALVRSDVREQLGGRVAFRTSLFASVLLAALCAPAPSFSRVAAPAREGAHGFDFLFGEWRVHHRIKRPTGEWYEFDGTRTNRPLMTGAANVEEHVFARPNGTTHGVGNFYSDYTDPKGKTVR